MKLRVFRTLWGVLADTDGEKAESPVLDIDEAFAEISRLGYDGVEVPFKFILFCGIDRLIVPYCSSFLRDWSYKGFKSC